MKYTGEAIDVDYPFLQTDKSFPSDVSAAVDGGFNDMAEDNTSEADVLEDVDMPPMVLPIDSEEDDVKVRYTRSSHVCT